MKRPNPASKKKNKKKTDASSLFCRCYLNLCSPTSAFKAPAGGDALSSAPWLLDALPVSLSSAGITLQTYFPYAACFWSFALRLQVCVWRGWRVICDKNLARLSRGFRFYWRCNPHQLIHGYLDGILSHLLNVCLVMVLASTSETAEKVDIMCLFHKHMSINSLLVMNWSVW